MMDMVLTQRTPIIKCSITVFVLIMHKKILLFFYSSKMICANSCLASTGCFSQQIVKQYKLIDLLIGHSNCHFFVLSLTTNNDCNKKYNTFYFS